MHDGPSQRGPSKRLGMHDVFDRLENRTTASREGALFRDLQHVLTVSKSRAPALRAQLKGLDIAKLRTRADLPRVPLQRRSDLLAAQAAVGAGGGARRGGGAARGGGALPLPAAPGGHEPGGVRIAHREPGRVANERQVQRVGGVDERDVLPGEAGAAHAGADLTVAERLGLQQAGAGAQLDRANGAEQGGDAARGVAAGAGLAAVGVVDAHHCGLAAVSGLEADQLVAAYAATAVGERCGAARGQGRERRRPTIEDDEVVSGAVHLGEAGQHGRVI